MIWNVKELLEKVRKTGYKPIRGVSLELYKAMRNRGRQRGKLSYYEIRQLNDWLPIQTKPAD